MYFSRCKLIGEKMHGCLSDICEWHESENTETDCNEQSICIQACFEFKGLLFIESKSRSFNKYILQSIDHFEDVGPCVVLASPGMLQSGLSRELFEGWCTDSKNGCIIAGYCVEGTLAKVLCSIGT